MRHALIVSGFALLIIAAAAPSAVAKPDPSSKPANRAEVKAASSMRMVKEYIELGELQMARDSLSSTVAKLAKAGSATRPIAAEVHVALGVVLVSGFKDTKGATEQFSKAIDIERNVGLPSFAKARSKLVFGRAYEAMFPTISCDKLLGVYHQPMTLAQEGAGVVIEAKLDKYLLRESMLILYRGAGGGAFQEASMHLEDGCLVRGEIPASDVAAPKIEYYLESRLGDGRPAARKGTEKLPFVVNVSFGQAASEPAKAQTSGSTVAAGVADDKGAGKPTGVEPMQEPSEDEVEEYLLATPPKAKGSGCAGCSSGGRGGLQSAGLLILIALLGLRRRRHSLPPS